MSIVADQVRRLDLEIEKARLGASNDVRSTAASDGVSADIATVTRAFNPSFSPLIRQPKLLNLLHETQALQSHEVRVQSSDDGSSSHANDVEWMLTAKATLQTYGLVLNTLVQETFSLSDDISFWDEVVGSYFYTALYTVQTTPVRLLEVVGNIYRTFRHRRSRSINTHISSLSDRWTAFYNVVHESVRDRSLDLVKSRALHPFALCRAEALQRCEGLKNMRVMNAAAIGLLVREGFSRDFEDKDHSAPTLHWQNVVRETTLLMQTVLQSVHVHGTELVEFEDDVFAGVQNNIDMLRSPHQVTKHLIQILERTLPEHQRSFKIAAGSYGRPSRIIRYWLPTVALLSSSATILRIITGRRAEIITWVTDLGTTVTDFWANWVIEPLKKVVGTIRHDEESEVALMSKSSLQADRESLERMVVDFVADQHTSDSSWSQQEIDIIKEKIKEGDLTPVLKAYERDLRQPFFGTVRGDLVRALLIQIQKTKVDVEVAIGGIDSLLKSQELVFGFVGLTPGILGTYAAFRWVSSIFGNRAGLRRGQKQKEMLRAFWNVYGVLTSPSMSPGDVLSYKDHGLLICEADVLCKRASEILPGKAHHEFHEDVNDLLSAKVGVARQLKILKRLRGKWLS